MHVSRIFEVLGTIIVLLCVSEFLIMSSQTDLIAIKRTEVGKLELWMSQKEASTLKRRMRGIRTYLEWGSGGSTLNLAPIASEHAASIEHNQDWCDSVRNKLAAQNYTTVKLYCAPCQHKNGTDGTYAEFRSYIDLVDRIGQATWDFVFIDGRARVAAAIKALSYITPKTIVALHDSNRVRWDNANTYAPVLHFYDVVEEISGEQGLAILRRKTKFDRLEGDHVAVQRILNTGNDIYKLSKNITSIVR